MYQIDGLTGLLDSVTDRNGNTLTFSAPGSAAPLARPSRSPGSPGPHHRGHGPNGEAIHYQYDDQGNLAAVTDRDGNTTKFVYDAARPIIWTMSSIPWAGRYQDRLRSEGRVIQSIDAEAGRRLIRSELGSSIETVFDALGNPTTYEYDDRGNIVAEVDPNGGITRMTYDVNSRHRWQTDPLGDTTSYTYDASGNVLTTTDPLGNVTRNTYGSYGEVLTTTDPLGSATTNAYDARGDLLSTTDPSGDLTKLTYDFVRQPADPDRRQRQHLIVPA